MALSTSDLWIILRGRDEASRAIRAVSRSLRGLDDQSKANLARANKMMDTGRALTSMGVGLAAVGAAGFFALERMGAGAREYESAAALALTQTDGINTSLGEMKRLGLDVARTVPAAFEEIQPALYDIFSSIDTNMNGARKLVKQFAKDAVAGGTDMKTVTRANLQVMNAYGIKVKDVSKVSDFFFQLVRKGVGDYKEMAGAIGKSIPSAARAGQSYKELGGMIAFLTRQGLTAAQAGTSAARAMDAIAHPKTIERLQDMGVQVKDAAGEFRPMHKIMQDLGSEMDKLTGPERSAALQELFKSSGGTIQAKRFFNAAFKNMDEYQQRVGDMNRTTGLAGQAFNTMAATSEAKVQQAKNNLKALGVEFGDTYNKIRDVAVVIVGEIAAAIGNLPGPLKQAIVYFTIIASTIAVLSGIVLILVGAWMMFQALMIITGTSLALVSGIVIGVVAAVALLAGAAFLIYKNWGAIKDFFIGVWNGIKEALTPAMDAIKNALGEVGDHFNSTLKPALMQLWTTIQPIVAKVVSFLPKLGDAAQSVGNAFMTYLWPAIKAVAKFLGKTFLGAIVGAVKGIITFVTGVVQVITGIIQIVKGIFTGDMSMIITGIKTLFTGLGNVIIGAIQFIWNVGILRLFRLGFTVLKAIVTAGWNLIKAAFMAAGRLILTVIRAPFQAMGGIIKGALNVIVNIVKTAWNVVKTVFSTVIKVIKALVTGNFKAIPGIIRSGLSKLGGIAKTAWNRVKTAFTDGVKRAVDKAKEIAGGVVGAMKKLPGKLKQAGIDAMKGLWNGLKEWGSKAVDKAKEIAGNVAGAVAGFFKIGSPSKLFHEIGVFVMQGLLQGMQKEGALVIDKASDLAQAITDSFAVGNRSRWVTGWVRKLFQDQYTEYAKTGNEVAKGVVDGFRDYIQTSNLSTTTDVFGETVASSADDVVRMLEERSRAVKQFSTDIESLRRRGLNSQMLSDLVGMGVESGGEFARNLATATDEQIRAINNAQKLATDEVIASGIEAGGTMFYAGKSAMQGFIEGLNSHESALKSALSGIAKLLSSQIKKELGIRSPSRVFMDIGRNLPNALALGMHREATAVATASRALANQASIRAHANFGASGPVDLGYNGGPTYHNEFNITTQEIDPRKHAADLGFEFNRRMV